MSISHSDQLASDFGRTVRDILKQDLYQQIFPGVNLRQDVRAAGKWKTKQNGTYFAAGVRSQVAGRGAHIALIDDAMSEEDAFSETGRKYIKDWYPAGLRTRLMPNGSIVIINTRYHEDDLCGWLLNNQTEETISWEVLSIPAWLDEESSKLLNLPVGSSYFPEWKPEKVLRMDEAEIRANNGAKYWNALYMQNPTPDEGGAIKSTWFKTWEGDDAPTCNMIIQTYDTAFSTKSTADYSVIQTWGIFDCPVEDHQGREYYAPSLILLGNTRERFEYPELRRVAQELYDEWKPEVCIVEKKASGQSLIQDMRRAGLPVLDYLPDRDKLSRVHAATPIMEAGRLWIPRFKDWAEDLYAEAIQFPYGKNDDQVDAMAMAIHYLKDSWHLTHPEDPEYESKPIETKRYWSFN
jgi:predicted phage terminase large subunit-like protein